MYSIRGHDTRLRCGYQWLRLWCTTILTIRFSRSFASPDISHHGNAVRMDSSGSGSGLGCKNTCLLMQSDFVSVTHLVERIDNCSLSRQRTDLVLQPPPPPCAGSGRVNARFQPVTIGSIGIICNGDER